MERKTQIELFFHGKLTKELAEDLLKWIHSDEGQAYLDQEMGATWEELEDEYAEFSVGAQDRLWQKLQRQNPAASFWMPERNRQPYKRSSWIWIAAAIGLLVGVLIGGFFLSDFDFSDNPSETITENWVERGNPPGQKTKIKLPDGSTVYLNADSKVRYGQDFSNNRKIYLDGEGFFEVVKDSTYPFVVESHGVFTEVVGTSFNISTFSKKNEVTVTVVSGRVMLGTDEVREGVFLDPGEEAKGSRDTEKFSKKKVDVSKKMLWVEGVLHFEDSPFDLVIETLSRWYGVTFELTGKVPDALSSGTFQRNESLENVLQVLGPTLGFTFEIDEKTVIIALN